MLVVALVAAGLASPAVPAEATPLPAPTITSVSPSTGPTAGGGVVTITGTNLATTQIVSFGSGSPANLAAQAVLRNLLTTAEAVYVQNAHEFPAAGPLSAVLESAHPGTSVWTEPVVFNATTPYVSLAVSDDGADVVLASASATGNCFYVEDNQRADAPPHPPGLPNGPPAAGTSYGALSLSPCDAASDPVVDWNSSSWMGLGGAAGAGSSCSDTQCTTIAPNGIPGTTDVAVATPTGIADDPSAFTYVAPPTITGVSPSTGPTAGGGVVTVTGTGLATTRSLTFDSQSPARTWPPSNRSRTP